MTHTGNPFGQVLVALITPMTADGEVDWPAVEKHIDDVRWVPFADVLAMIARGEITDGETVAALAYAGIRLGRFA